MVGMREWFVVEIKRQRLLSGAKLPSCVRREGALRRRFSCREVGGIQAVRIRFVLAATHDGLPHHANVARNG